MMIAALAAAIAMTPSAACAQQTGTEAQQTVESTVRGEWLPEFTEVKVRAAIEIKFVQVAETDAPRIVYDTKGETDTKFKAAVDRNGVLTISEKILRNSRSRTVVEVYYHSLKSVNISDAYASFDGTVRGRMMNIEVSGGSKVAAEVDIADMEVWLSGKNTRAKLSGTARYVEIEASAGMLDASALEAMSVEVTATYGASVAVRATERLKTSASTSATIAYRGTPTIVKGRAAVLGGTVKSVNESED